MWVFTNEGVTIYSNDGREVKKKVGKDVGVAGDAYEVQSDGHRYVWAANTGDRVDVFDIDTGDYAGYVPSCGNPAMELRYLPTRQEMWLRCARPSDDEVGHIDVFSTNSLSSNHEGITLPGSYNYGWGLEAHSTLGNYAYVSPYAADYMFQIDLSSKEIITNYSFPEGVASSYDMTYSPTNRHIFGKARVCCSCGFAGADNEQCPARGVRPVIVTNGPNASPVPQNGTCGGSCEGTAADTIGTFEFDTISKTFVANHNGVAGNGATPLISGDGQHIVLATHDGGETVRVLKAGANGYPSTVAADIPVNFGGDYGRETVSDIAFIRDDNRNFLVIAGWGNNEVVIVDIDADFRMHKLRLSDNPEPTADGQRNVEWAVGSDYVWIGGPQAGEIYIVKIDDTIESARVSKVITSVAGDTGNFDNVLIVHVDNYERPAPPTAPTGTSTNPLLGNGPGKEEDRSTKAFSLAAFVIACIALLWTAAITIDYFPLRSNTGAFAKEQAPSIAGEKSLGSKQAV